MRPRGCCAGRAIRSRDEGRYYQKHKRYASLEERVRLNAATIGEIERAIAAAAPDDPDLRRLRYRLAACITVRSKLRRRVHERES
jgi:hypothetical protein